jgi:hypothetical protein
LRAAPLRQAQCGRCPQKEHVSAILLKYLEESR